MFFCNESPRWLAKQDRWEEAKAVLAKVRMLPATHEYVETEYQDMVHQLESERRLLAGAGFKVLMKEMWTIPGNRKRALISVVLMICQQMTGTNAINVSRLSNVRHEQHTDTLRAELPPSHVPQHGHRRPLLY